MDQARFEKFPDVQEPASLSPSDAVEKLGNASDQQGMHRMGKKQVLRRQFQFFSITGYAMILGASWETATVSVHPIDIPKWESHTPCLT